MNTNDESLIREVLDSRNSIVKIDANDVRDLFQEGGEIHAYNASVDASMKKRMELLMDLIIVNTKKYEPIQSCSDIFILPRRPPFTDGGTKAI